MERIKETVTLLLISLLICQNAPIKAQHLLKPTPQARELEKEDNIEVFVHLRNYLTGPIEDQFAIFNHDTIGAYVGPINPDFITRTYPNAAPGTKEVKYVSGTVRTWGMVGVNDDGYQICILQAIHNFGELAFFTCPKPGVYRIYAWDKLFADRSGGKEMDAPDISQPEDGADRILAWYTTEGRKYFDLFERDPKYGFQHIFDRDPTPFILGADLGPTIEEKHKKAREIFLGLSTTASTYKIALSDPIYVTQTTNCYYWMYRMDETARVGYVEDSEVSPEVGTGGSTYIALELLIWIAEPNAVPIEEATLPLNKIKISEYSKMLTKRYFTLGLFPCLRMAHPAVEITSDISFVYDTAQHNRLRSPHWRASLKIHTDRVLTTLSDVSFTIANRQNAALFGCFVGDTRVFINTREFQFVTNSVLDRTSINLKLSKLQDVFTQKVKFQITQVFGHGVQFIGDIEARRYQPGTSRTDLVIINNPCIAQEFAVSVGGSLYVAEGLLSQGLRQMKKVYLPGLDDTNSPGKTVQGNRNYLRVADVAFTPTHFVLLLSSGFIILHPTSIRHKGIARMTNTQKHRADVFVRRRWCGRTSTPKLSNMIVPGFTSGGSIIIIQIYPIEGSVHMWVNPPSQFCLSEGEGFIGKADELKSKINETEIHFNEYVSVNRSDDIGITIPTPPKRPEPPATERDRDTELAYLINNETFIDIGGDPHFPPELANPASQMIGENLENYNSAVIYVLDEIVEKSKKNIVSRLIELHDLKMQENSFDLQAVEFTAVEKQFIIGVKFAEKDISDVFRPKGSTHDIPPFQMLITTVTVTNFPTVVTVPEGVRGQDETLQTIVPFPGTLLIRSKPFTVDSVESRDPDEYKDVPASTSTTSIPYRTKIFPVSTALPAYVVDLGNALLFSSLDGRYARPLYFYDWCKLDHILNKRHKVPEVCIPKGSAASSTPPPPTGPTGSTGQKEEIPDLKVTAKVSFNDSTPLFYVDKLHDIVVTAQGIISIMWRKDKRHLIRDDRYCLNTSDTSRNAMALGSVLINDGLRDVHGFYQNDNIFQMGTPDGEIIYGKYEVKPHAPFADCDIGSTPQDTASSPEICIQQAETRLSGQQEYIPVCSKATVTLPCRDPGYIQHCSNTSVSKTEACLRLNSLPDVVQCADDRFEDKAFHPPEPVPEMLRRTRRQAGQPPKVATPDPENIKCYNDTLKNVTGCWPMHAPREELRSIKITGVSFYGYLHGSLKSVKSVHPEAPVLDDGDYSEEELDVCPFVGFSVYNVDFDFAEVGYQTRVTGQISFLGTGIPTEADLIVEFQPIMGVVVSVSASVEDDRDLTTITKIIDITFVLTDFQFDEIRSDKVDYYNKDFYADRAREKSSIFSLTLRPTIVNMYCKNQDYFKTIQFSVGCNTFSYIRLVSEASPFNRFAVNNEKDTSKSGTNLKWQVENNRLVIPKTHVYHLQVKGEVFNCSLEDNTRCLIPFYELFKDNIFTTSYRDSFIPKFEQFLTVSTRVVTGNMILYDLKGSKDFNVSVNNLQAGCYSTGDSWYDDLSNSTDYINRGKSEHEYIYSYYKDCFENSDPTKREQSQTLDQTPFYLFNSTNNNEMKFRRQRNQLFIFRAVVMNTAFNRFTYCKTLETFFLVRIQGIPIPRQGLALWIYIVIIFGVVVCLLISYIVFFHFYTWKLDASNPMMSTADTTPGSEPGEIDRT